MLGLAAPYGIFPIAPEKCFSTYAFRLLRYLVEKIAVKGLEGKK